MKKSRTGSITGEALSSPPVATVQLPLWDAVTTVREGFFALCVATGQQVLAAMMEHDRQQLCGPKNVPNPARTAYRAGTVPGEVTLGGRRVPIRRLRARRVDGGELGLPSFAFAAARDPLNARTLAAIAIGVATRQYARSLDPLPIGWRQRSVSKSAVSRRFVALSAVRLTAWLAQPLDRLDVRTAVCQALLTDLRERGLDLDRPVLVVVDGAPGLRKAIRAACPLAVLHRCQLHKGRNVLDHLPEALRPSVHRALSTSTTPPWPSAASSASPRPWSATTPGRRTPCGKGSQTRSPCNASASPERSTGRCGRRT
jgi:putative transposase